MQPRHGPFWDCRALVIGPYVAENSKNVGWGDSPKDTETVADLHTR